MHLDLLWYFNAPLSIKFLDDVLIRWINAICNARKGKKGIREDKIQTKEGYGVNDGI